MINNFDSEFLIPTKQLRRLSVLTTIAHNPKVSQHKIGKATHMSSAMVNNYIKTLQEDGLIRISGQTNRTQKYHLTDDGRDELLTLFHSYSAEIFSLYSITKQQLIKKLTDIHRSGVTAVALAGISDTAEIIYAAIRETPLQLTAVCDTDEHRQGIAFNEYIIQPLEYLRAIQTDAIIIGTRSEQEKLAGAIQTAAGPKTVIKNLFEP